MKILVLNAGSSSLKYQLFNMETGEVRKLDYRLALERASGKASRLLEGGTDYEEQNRYGSR